MGKEKKKNRYVRVCLNAKKSVSLACKSCVTYCQTSGIASPPFNIIMCQDGAHTKPSPEEVCKALQDYWPAFNPGNVVNSMVLDVGSVHNTVNKLPPCLKSSRPSNDPFQVIFDTETGISTKVGIDKNTNQGDMTPQPNPSIYVMQWLKIGNFF